MGPNFLVIGAAKSGTTSLYQYLRQHPQVFLAPGKDTSYFGGREGREHTGMSWQGYLSLFQGSEGYRAVGEASVAYLYSEAAPRRILEALGAQVKIVVLLRNPVDMAYSLWGQNVRDGGESLSFRDALQAETARMSDAAFSRSLHGAWKYNYAYLDRAKYAIQLQRYFEVFGAANIHVALYEQFFADPRQHFQNLLEFLGLDPLPDLSSDRIYNAAGTVYWKALMRFYTVQSPMKSWLLGWFPRALRKRLYMALYDLNSKTEPLPALDVNVRQQLMSELKDDMDTVERLTALPIKRFWAVSAENRLA